MDKERKITNLEKAIIISGSTKIESSWTCRIEYNKFLKICRGEIPSSGEERKRIETFIQEQFRKKSPSELMRITKFKISKRKLSGSKFQQKFNHSPPEILNYTWDFEKIKAS